MKRHLGKRLCIPAAMILLLLLIVCGLGHSMESPAGKSLISGTVTDDDGPVAGATVRLQGSTKSVFTNAAGFFQLTVPAAKVVNVGAWKQGYYCALLREVTAPAQELNLKLRRYQTNDNSAYEWIPPETPEGTGGCSQCHIGHHRDGSERCSYEGRYQPPFPDHVQRHGYGGTIRAR